VACVLHVLNNLVQVYLFRICQVEVIYAVYIDAISFCEDVFISSALIEPNEFELADKVIIPKSSCLFLPIDINVDL